MLGAPLWSATTVEKRLLEPPSHRTLESKRSICRLSEYPRSRIASWQSVLRDPDTLKTFRHLNLETTKLGSGEAAYN
jgi:hypothetical protein